MSLQGFLWGIAYFSAGSVLIPILCFVVKKNRTKVGWLLFALLIVSLLSDVGNYIYSSTGHRSYLIVNLFFVLQFILLSQIYALLLQEWKIVYGALVVFLIFAILNTLFLQSFNDYQSFLRLVGGVLIIGLAVLYYVRLCKTLPAENILRFSSVWIANATFYYFSFNLFLFAIANFIFYQTSSETGMAMWAFHNLNNIIKNCLFAVAIYFGNDNELLKK